MKTQLQAAFIGILIFIGMSFYACSKDPVKPLDPEKEEIQSTTSENSDPSNPDTPDTPDPEPVAPGEAKATLVSSTHILTNEEPSETVMNTDLRWFRLQEPIRVETSAQGVTLAENQILITSYALRPITNLTIQLDGNSVFTIDELPELSQSIYTLPEDNYKADGKYTVTSNDPLFTKLIANKFNYKLHFVKRNAQWLEIGGLEARELIATFTNFAFAMSHEWMGTLLDNYETLTGGKFLMNQSAQEYWDVKAGSAKRTELENIIFQTGKEKLLGIGLVDDAKLGGQAYGDACAISADYLSTLYVLGATTYVHEFGHTLGYGHETCFSLFNIDISYEQNSTVKDSNFKGSFMQFAGAVDATLQRFNYSPYNAEDVAYYSPKNAAYRKRNSGSNRLDPSTLERTYQNYFVQRSVPMFYFKYATVPFVYIPEPDPFYKDRPYLITHNPSSFFLNCFERAVYKNPSLYPELNNSLKPYFDQAKEKGTL